MSRLIAPAIAASSRSAARSTFEAGARFDRGRFRGAGVDRGVAAGDVIRVGRHIELQCLDTPGHTLCHICLFAHADEPALFSGDTLFNAGLLLIGCGNTRAGDNFTFVFLFKC